MFLLKKMRIFGEKIRTMCYSNTFVIIMEDVYGAII